MQMISMQQTSEDYTATFQGETWMNDDLSDSNIHPDVSYKDLINAAKLIHLNLFNLDTDPYIESFSRAMNRITNNEFGNGKDYKITESIIKTKRSKKKYSETYHRFTLTGQNGDMYIIWDKCLCDEPSITDKCPTMTTGYLRVGLLLDDELVYRLL